MDVGRSFQTLGAVKSENRQNAKVFSIISFFEGLTIESYVYFNFFLIIEYDKFRFSNIKS